MSRSTIHPLQLAGRFAWAVVLTCALFVFAFAALPAHAKDAEVMTLATTSAQKSVDGNDYGWLWLASDDCFYPIDKPASRLYLVCGYAQDSQGVTRVYNSPDLGNMRWKPQDYCPYIYETIYRCGVLTYSFDSHIRLDLAVLNEESHETWHKRIGIFSTGPKVFSSENAYESLRSIRFDPAMVKHVVFEDNVAPYWRDHKPLTNSDGHGFLYLNNWFRGCYNLTSIEGFEYISTDDAKSMAYMFANCESLIDLDLSMFDTSACEDFSGMFEGCSMLDSLALGDGWTQAGAVESKRATFPQPMKCEETGEAYSVGDIIPDGAGTYTFFAGFDRVNVSQATVLFGNPGQIADTEPGSFCCEYTGKPLKPSISLEYQGALLQEGVDYRVRYTDNTKEGVGTVSVYGLGAYTGTRDISFTIADTSAHAFLFSDGTLIIKANHAHPNTSQIAPDISLRQSYRWFDSQTEDPGAEVPWSGQASHVKRVVIDGSFASFQPVTAERWFAGCSNLTSVQGLGNIDLSAACSVAGMFECCTSLVELDVSGLQTSSIEDFNGFVSGCSQMEGLYLGNLDMSNATTAAGFYSGCDNLKNLHADEGWRNCDTGLAFADAAHRVAPSYARYKAGDAVPSGAGEYLLSDVPMQSVKIVMPALTYNCTGKPITPKPKVYLAGEKLTEGADYTLKYANNVYPGTAKLTVQGAGAFSGSMVVNYKIKSVISAAGDRVTFKNKDVVYALSITKVKKKGGHVAAANATITKVTVNNKSMAKLSLPSTCTIGGVKVSITAVGNKLQGKFRNVKTVVIGSTVTRIGSRAFANAPKVKTLQIKSKRLTSVTGCLKGSKVTKVQVKVSLSSAKKKSYKKMFTEKAGKSITYRYG